MHFFFIFFSLSSNRDGELFLCVVCNVPVPGAGASVKPPFDDLTVDHAIILYSSTVRFIGVHSRALSAPA